MIFAVCAYFAFALVGEQELNHKDGELPADQFFLIFDQNPGKFQHTVFPIFLFLKFIFFNGWMGVALALDDPWEGVDKEDFKVVEGKLFEFIQNIFSQIKELVQRHLWSIGRSLRQEEKDLLWSVIKAKKDEAS